MNMHKQEKNGRKSIKFFSKMSTKIGVLLLGIIIATVFVLISLSVKNQQIPWNQPICLMR